MRRVASILTMLGLLLAACAPQGGEPPAATLAMVQEDRSVEREPVHVYGTATGVDEPAGDAEGVPPWVEKSARFALKATLVAAYGAVCFVTKGNCGILPPLPELDR